MNIKGCPSRNYKGTSTTEHEPHEMFPILQIGPLIILRKCYRCTYRRLF